MSILSCVLAISGIMDHYIGFLYLIASVFAPMAAVLMVSFYFHFIFQMRRQQMPKLGTGTFSHGLQVLWYTN